MKKILVTGFDPFGGEPVNPAWEAVSRLTAPEGVELHKKMIPTVYYESVRILTEELRAVKPDAVILVGQAAGRKQITPERVAINVNDARICDNAGQQPVDEAIVPGGENAYFSGLPIRTITDTLNAAGIPAGISNTAGTFVCNHLMYGLLHYIEKEAPEMTGGFIHVPCIPEQLSRMPEGTPAMPLEEIIRGLDLVLTLV